MNRKNVVKHARCWAQALDDCSDQISREHLVSSITWPGVDRESRDSHPITAQGGVYRDGTIDTSVPEGFVRHHTVANLTKKVLCTHHNRALSECDVGAGNLARALDEFWATCLKRPYDTLSYTKKRFVVDMRPVERWFLKSAINFATEKDGEPIGAFDAPPGLPAPELVDVVFGRCAPPEGVGLWTVDAPPRRPEELNSVAFRLWRREHERVPGRFCIAGCFVHFRGLLFAVNLEQGTHPPPAPADYKLGSRGRFVRNGEVAMASRNVTLRFSPDGSA